jgi:hypothetical protein
MQIIDFLRTSEQRLPEKQQESKERTEVASVEPNNSKQHLTLAAGF